eukprot:CAMPEP_0118945154 /NCGR_PEP_ID=MMETSP1169-20130426/41733_1 /TAXON_ID=36882 /ORGANISM="Pyramimonas obovata, Strain CCMP722" /LENGTH=162 /DNA_ID=CAMNT_0006890803 /DNA_START=169 /DNA_END=654 /DNA_ORIENTATION=+
MFSLFSRGPKEPKVKVKRADLGEKNKFYYDEKLKRWIDPMAKPTEEEKAEEAPPPPPSIPSTSDLAGRASGASASFQSIGSAAGNDNGDRVPRADDSYASNLSTLSSADGSGPPPMAGIKRVASGSLRSRYVDVGFGKGGAASNPASPHAPNPLLPPPTFGA